MRGSVRYGGECAAFGRDDGILWRSIPHLRFEMWGTRFGGSFSAGGEVGIGGGEAGEVVRAEDVTGGLVEGREIERPGAWPDEGREGWGADAVRFVD